MTNNNLKLGNDETLMNNKKYQNTALGVKSFKASRTGINNTAIGFRSLKNSKGNSNTAIGSFSGENLNFGNQNILIGKEADVESIKVNNQIKANNQIVIGCKSKGHGDNIMVLGNSETVSIDPSSNNKTNLGSKKYQYKNLYIDGNIYKDGSKAIIDGGSINNLTDGKSDASNVFLGLNSGSSLTTGTNNSALGIDSLRANTTGNYNTASGYQSLLNNTTGNYNTAFGWLSLYRNTTGDANTAYGIASLRKNTTGLHNVAVGYLSLRNNTTANNNTAVGYSSLFTNTTGLHNVAVGYQTLHNNTNGFQNTACGSLSLYNNTTGYANTAVGDDAGFYLTTGSRNTLIGENAGVKVDRTTGVSLTTGSNNIIVGKEALNSAEDADNEIIIGYHATGKGTNTAVIGNDDVTNVYMSGDSGATVHCAGITNTTTAGLLILKSNGGTNEKITIQNNQGQADDAIKLDCGAIGGGITIGNTTNTNNKLIFSNLPTSEPSIIGQVWNDNGTLKIKTS